MLPRLINETGGRIATPALFFSELGNLHDAKIQLIEWDPVQSKISFVLDDLYSNFVGLPEYPGTQSVRLILSNVSKLEIDVTPDKFPMRVIDFEVEEEMSDSRMRVLVNVGPTGLMQITCGSIEGHFA